MKGELMNELAIFTTYDSFEADSIIATMQDKGIPAYKRIHGAGSFMNITLGFNRSQPIDIIIPEAAEDVAVDLLADMGLVAIEDE